MSKNEKIIYGILAAVTITWGLNVVLIKYLTQFISPMLVVAIRMPLAGIAVLLFAWMRYGWYRPQLKQWILIVYVALTTIFIHQILMSYGVVETTATNAALILGLNPLITALLAALFTKEKLNWRLGIGAIIGFSGVVIAVTSKSGNSSISLSGWGDLIMFLSMLGFVVGGLLVKQVMTTGIPILVVSAYSTLLGGILINIGAVFVIGTSGYNELLQLDLLAWTAMIISALGASALGTIGWNYGIKMLGAARTALFLNGLPFASMVGGAIILHEHILFIHFVAFVLTVVGIIIGTSKQRERLY